MSRICVKNLPRYVAEDRLKDFFSQKGEVTDAKIMRTKDGKSRQFAFIGFRTITEADDAIKFFNNSYLDTCRITCEVARKVGDPDIPRPWSRYTAKKEDALNDEDKTSVVAKGPVLSNDDGAGISTNIAKKFKEINENSDSQLQEFLQVMQPRIKTKLWANDTLGFPLLDQSDREKKECQSHKENKKQAARESRNRESGADQEDQSTVLQNGSVVEVSEKKALHELARDEVISDLDYFKSRVKKDWTDSESDNEDLLSDDLDDQEDDEMDGEEAPGVKIGENSHSENFEGENTGKENSSDLNDEKGEVLETGRLFVRNLPYTANEEDLVELFSKHGDVLEVHLVVDRDTKRSKGIAYVLYTLPESALRAMQELDNSIFQGRLLHVMPAKQPLEKKESNLGISGVSKTFKQQREEQKKASEASGDTRAWNSLFMRSDTVVENIARKYAVSKSELLDREGNDLAVRIALGETQVIAETKNELINAGFNVEALENFAAGKAEGVKRSGHVILVKNLPYGSSEGDLFKMFSKFGSLDKIFLPSTKTLALVVFLEAAEARTAFKGLAYKRYKDAPLYLEWAPANILTSSSKKKTADQNNQAVGEKNVKRVLLEQNVQGISEVDIDPDRVESRSVFVKNLNFKTTDESLKKHFTDTIKEGKIQSVKIKKHLKNAKTLSMGFGFVEFDSIESAANACRDLQGTVLEGHALLLQLCRGKQNEARVRRTDKDKSSTKLIVRNVAFEATEKDLRQLFSPFGQIKSLRLPMKMGGHRGFAFVEYVTKQEAQNALQALSNTHLYGRHLVLEQAKEGETLEELRARTAAQFSDEQNGFQIMSKLSKKRKHMSTLDEGSVKFERIMGFQ